MDEKNVPKGRVKWDQVGQRKFKVGCDHGIIYPQRNGSYPKGAPWNGLTQVTKSPGGAEETKLYADNMQYLNMRSAETLNLTLECYMYPPEFEECNGESEIAKGVKIHQQRRNTFGFSYRNKLGNDTEGEDFGFELNLVYGCSATPSEESNGTINESPDVGTFSYDISTTPVNVSGLGPDGKPYKPTACVTINSTEISREKLVELEDILYGTDPEYGPTSDTEFAADKTYYEKVSGEYVETSDTSYVEGKSYYEITKEGMDGRLPFPDELKEFMAAG